MESITTPATPPVPFGIPAVGETGIADVMRELQSMKARLSTVENQIMTVRGNLNNPRIRIQNLEGVFKMVSTAPSNSDDFQEGSILMYFDGSSTYRIYAKINKTWRYATLT